MPDLTAKRTLVKSPPELWDELSEVDRLAKHLDAFGEIRITKLEPEHTVAWEGEHASGTVSIEPSGWGTKVTLTAELPGQEPAPEPEPPPEPVALLPEPEPEPVPEAPVLEEPVLEEPVSAPPIIWEPPAPRRRRGFWGWLFRERTATQRPVLIEPEPEPEPVEPEPVEPEPLEPELVEPEPVEPEPVEPEPVEPEPVQPEPLAAPPEADPEPVEPMLAGVAAEDAQTALDGMLDALGSAHHRPFSRG